MCSISFSFVSHSLAVVALLLISLDRENKIVFNFFRFFIGSVLNQSDNLSEILSNGKQVIRSRID